MEMEEKKATAKQVLKITGIVLAIAVVVGICVFLIPYLYHFQSLKGEKLDAALASADGSLRRLGPLRYLAMCLLQILQMILAIIPGAPVAVMMGFMFGSLGGTVLTILSTAAGTALIVWCVEHFGLKFVNRFINSKGFEKLTFLHSASKRDTILFLLFLIPGTPKDLLTFFAPFTGAKSRNIVIMASLARIPSIFLMVYLGSSLSQGNLVKVIIVITIAAVIGLVGILIKDKVLPARKEKKMQNKNTVIFDLDGTLLDTLSDLTDATNFALRENGYPEKTEDQVRNYVGNGLRLLIERAVPKGEKDPKLESTLESFKRYYAVHCNDKTKAYEGIPQLLTELRDGGYKLAIVSNKADFAVQTLRERYFSDTVPVAIGESANVRKKPAPDSVLEALKRLDSTPEQAVYVGDSDVDIQTAKNAGMDCISVTWGFRSVGFLVASGATCTVNRPDEIGKILRGTEEKVKPVSDPG
ncbi:MAG: HAD-IIIA family hydrolase [Eubacteriales bacterium]